MEKIQKRMNEEQVIFPEFQDLIDMFHQVISSFSTAMDKLKYLVNYCREGVQNYTIISRNLLNEVVSLEEKLEQKNQNNLKDKANFFKSAANLESVLIQQLLKEKSSFSDENQLQFLKLRVQNQIKETLQAKGVYMVSHADKNYIGDYVQKDIVDFRIIERKG